MGVCLNIKALLPEEDKPTGQKISSVVSASGPKYRVHPIKMEHFIVFICDLGMLHVKRKNPMICGIVPRETLGSFQLLFRLKKRQELTKGTEFGAAQRNLG